MADNSLQQLNPNVVFYSDSFISLRPGSVDRLEGIILKLATINIGKGKIDELPREKIHHYQRWADSMINSALSSVVTIPLVRITRIGRNLNQSDIEVPFFPDPIPEIATAIVVSQIVFYEYTDVDPNISAAVNTLYESATKQLMGIAGMDAQIGIFRLEGQQLRTRHPFAPPGAMPLNVPKSQ